MKKIIIIPIPKNASTSLNLIFAKNNLLNNIDFGHKKLSQILPLINENDNIIIACIRNPYHRLISFYYWTISWNDKYYELREFIQKKYKKDIDLIDDNVIMTELINSNIIDNDNEIFLENYFNNKKEYKKIKLIRNTDRYKLIEKYKNDGFVKTLEKTLNDKDYFKDFYIFIHNSQLSFITPKNKVKYFIKQENLHEDINNILNELKLDTIKNKKRNISIDNKNIYKIELNNLKNNKILLKNVNILLKEDFKYFNYKILI
jgi:hypothetical protein